MQSYELYFVIPTYRLRDVGETVKLYDEHFWRNGHSPTLIGSVSRSIFANTYGVAYNSSLLLITAVIVSSNVSQLDQCSAHVQ